jgi:hypothetical protein
MNHDQTANTERLYLINNAPVPASTLDPTTRAALEDAHTAVSTPTEEHDDGRVWINISSPLPDCPLSVPLDLLAWLFGCDEKTLQAEIMLQHPQPFTPLREWTSNAQAKCARLDLNTPFETITYYEALRESGEL